MMLPSRPRILILAVLWVGLSLAPTTTCAQSLWIPRDVPTAILLEVLHVDVNSLDEDFLTGVAFLGVRDELSPGTAFVAELPYTHFKGTSDDIFGTEMSESSIGNPYFGVEISGEGSPFFGEVGIRAPLMQDEIAATFTGLFSDLPRSFAFFPNTVPIQAAVNVRTPGTSEIRARLRFGPTVAVPTTGRGRDTELYGVYAWEIGYEGRSARVGSALSGWILFTGDFGTLGSRALTQFEFHADFGSGRVRPGARLIVPFGAGTDFTSSVMGLSLAVAP